MDKVIDINGQGIKFRATARTPRLYRAIIGRDMIQDMARLKKSFQAIENVKDEEKADVGLSVLDLQIFEDTAYIMAKQADPENITMSADEWLDRFDMFSIYEILPQLLQLWGENIKTTAKPKKK